MFKCCRSKISHALFSKRFKEKVFKRNSIAALQGKKRFHDKNDNGNIKFVMGRVPLDEEGKPDLNKAKEILLQAISTA